jgi:hypothetical protein
MAGQAQQLRAVSPRDGKAPANAVKERVGVSDRPGQKRPYARDATQLPPPLPLDDAEADLCERLKGLLATAPRRCGDEPPAARVEYSDRIATVAEVVPEPPELPPFTALPEVEAAMAAPAIQTIKWMHRSRRERFRSALGHSAAWSVTLAVIALTVAGATVMTLGAEKSSSLAAMAMKQGAQAASTAAATLKQLIKQ